LPIKTKVAKAATPASSVSGQRNYELMLVVNPTLTEEGLSATLTGLSQFLLGLGATISENKQLGKRRLAYPIKHQGEGYYFLLHFQAKAEVGPQLETRLNILEEVLRYLLVVLD
jgi:small subunit ribosomal protein S6